MTEQEAQTPEAADLAAAQAAEQAEAARAAYSETAGEDPAGDPTSAVPPAGADEDAVAEDTRSREELLAALAAAEGQRDEYLDDVRRLQAEFENFRKRSMREGATQRAAGVVDLTGKLLDVLDDFDMAMLSVGSRPASADDTDDVKALHKGLELVYSKLISVLKGAGLERIDGELVPFDPEKHEAVQQVEAEDGPHEHPIVVDVLRPGYQMDGRVIRAAMVKVAQ